MCTMKTHDFANVKALCLVRHQLFFFNPTCTDFVDKYHRTQFAFSLFIGLFLGKEVIQKLKMEVACLDFCSQKYKEKTLNTF